MNDDFSEQIFDSLLKEAVSGKRPPDLRARIQDAWQREKEQGEKQSHLVQAELVPSPPPITSTTEDHRDRDSVSPRHQVEPNIHAGQVASRLRTLSGSRKRSLFATVASVAAAILIIATSWQLVIRNGGSNSQLAEGEEAPGSEQIVAPEAPLLAENSTSVSSEGSGLPSLGMEGAVAGIESQVMDLEDLPFPNQPNGTIENRDASLFGVAKASKAEPINDAQIVNAVDSIFDRMWSDADVAPSPALDVPNLASKIYRTTTGKEIPAELKKRIASTPESFAQDRFASRVLETKQYRTFWANRLANKLMRSASISSGQDELTSIKSLFATQLVNGDWSEVPSKLIAGDLGKSESPSNAFMKGLAVGGENHRLVNRLSTSFLDANVGCAKCHDGLGGNREPALDSQKSYWGLVALLKGLEAKGNANAGTRVLEDRQTDLFAAKTPIVYYEEQDGNLRSVAAALPGLSGWQFDANKSPREALASWITQSSAFDRAVVNEAWQLVFGRRLVENSMLEPMEGRELRANALDLLAQQFRAHGHDYRRMLGWIIGSKAFARSEVSLTSEQWLASSDVDLKKLQKAELLFAAQSSLGKGREANSIQSSLAAVLKWKGANLDVSAESTLGQPDVMQMNKPEKIREAMRKQNRMTIAMPSKGYLLHGELHTDEKSRFVQSIVDNTALNWRQKVQHVVTLVASSSVINDKFMEGANSILESSDADQAEALLTILWAIEHNQAR